MLKTYDLKNVVFSLKDVLLSGYGDSGQIVVRWASDRASYTIGGDGQATLSRLNNNAVEIDVTLMEFALSTKAMYKLYRELAQETVIGEHAIRLYDFGNGDLVQDSSFGFLKLPEVSKGRETTDRTFTIFLPEPTVEFAELIER